MRTARNHNFYFRIHLYNPAANEKMRYSRIRVIHMGGGGGGRSIRKLWPLGIPDIIQSKLEYAGMKLEYLSYIMHYVCTHRNPSHLFLLNSPLTWIRSESIANWRKVFTIKTWVIWNETRISQLYHYDFFCMWSAGTPLYVFQILLVKSSSQWENALFGYTCNPYRRGGGRAVDQKVVAAGYTRHYNQNLSF